MVSLARQFFFNFFKTNNNTINLLKKLVTQIKDYNYQNDFKKEEEKNVSVFPIN